MIATSITVTMTGWQLVLLTLALMITFFVVLFLLGQRLIYKRRVEELEKSLDETDEELQNVRQDALKLSQDLHATQLFAEKALYSLSSAMTHSKCDKRKAIDGSIVAEWKQLADTFKMALNLHRETTEFAHYLKAATPAHRPDWSEALQRRADLFRRELTCIGHRMSRPQVEACAELLGRGALGLQRDVKELLTHERS